MDMGDLLVKLTPRPVRNAVERKLHGYLQHEAREAIREDISSLVDAQRTIHEEAQRLKYAHRLNALLSREPWAVDSIDLSEAHIEMRGWALPPLGDHSLAGFCVNGQSFEEVHYPLIRPDVGEAFWFKHRAAESGFICRTSFSEAQLEQDQSLVLSFLRKDLMQPVTEGHNYYYYDYTKDSLPLPEPRRRARSHGNDSESSFRIEGYSTFVKLRRALNRTLNKDFSDFASILDWGCGCGRVTRYFGTIEGPSLLGVDIDRDNIAWCERNLPFARFSATPLHPPTHLEDDSVDLLIGISVFTHLREKEQLEWLAELKRVARPGAVLMMTVLGDQGICRGGLNRFEFEDWSEHGINAIKGNADLDGYISDSEYYRNTFHTFRYIKETWSQYFSIVDIIRGYIGNQQDLVILQKPDQA